MINSLKGALKKCFGYFYLYSGLAGLANMLAALVFPGRKKLLILYYHGVGEQALGKADNMPCAEFERQLSYLQSHYQIISLDRAIKVLADEYPKVSGNLAVLTFDDAYKGVYDNAYPLLKERGFPAAVFVPAGCVGHTNNWEKNEKQYSGEIMTWNMVQQMADDQLITIGSHGMTHNKLSSLSISDIRNELNNSKQLLETKLALKVKYFTYPYGQAPECSDHIIDEVRRSGYLAACSTIWGRFNSRNNMYKLRRIRIDYEDSLSDFKLKINGGYDWIEYFHLLKGLLKKRPFQGKSGDL